MSEHDHQVAVIQWFGLQYPNTRIIAIPNGMWIAGNDKTKDALINKYKKEGWTPGVTDLFICHSDGQHHGLWLEMKDEGKTSSSLSAEQIQWITAMNKAGYLAKWAAGSDHAIDIIADYMVGHYRTGK